MDTKGFFLSPTRWVELPANPFYSWELKAQSLPFLLRQQA